MASIFFKIDCEILAVMLYTVLCKKAVSLVTKLRIYIILYLLLQSSNSFILTLLITLPSLKHETFPTNEETSEKKAKP